MTKWRGGRQQCEVCSDGPMHRHGGGWLEVGRKVAGTARVIHDRPKCRRRWDEQGATIRAGWPENRPAAGPLDARFKQPIVKLMGTPLGGGSQREIPFMRHDGDNGETVLRPDAAALKAFSHIQAHVQHPAPESFRVSIEYPDEWRGQHVTGAANEVIGKVVDARVVNDAEGRPALVATMAGGERLREIVEGNMATVHMVGEKPALTLHTDRRARRYQFKPETLEWLRGFYGGGRQRQHGDGERIEAVLEHMQPELLIDLEGRRIPPDVLKYHAQRLAMDRVAAPKPQSAEQQLDEVTNTIALANRCVMLGARISQEVWALVAGCDAATLDAVHDLLTDTH